MHFHTIIEILDQVCTWKVIWNLKLMNKDLAYRNWSKVALYIWNWLVLPLSPSPFESTSKKLLMSNSWLIQACNRKATKCCYFANMPGGTRVPISRDQTCMADIVDWKLTATTICLNWVRFSRMKRQGPSDDRVRQSTKSIYTIQKNTIKAGGSTAFEQNVDWTGWVSGYPLDCYDY